MTSTISVFVNACGPVNGILRPTSSSVSSALAATAEMSRSTIGAVDAVAIRAVDHIARLDLRRPHAEEVGDEHRWAQAHPLQTGIDGELLHFFVAVTAETRRLAREVVVGVDGRQRNEARDTFAACPTYQRFEFVAECA